jgi:hypothetical protein
MSETVEDAPRPRLRLPSPMTIVGLMLVAIAVGAVIFLLFARRTAEIGGGFVAKQMCSCLFVAGRPYESCVGDFDPATLAQMDITYVDRKVIVNAAGLDQVAAELTPGFGCALEPFDGGGF